MRAPSTRSAGLAASVHAFWVGHIAYRDAEAYAYWDANELRTGNGWEFAARDGLDEAGNSTIHVGVRCIILVGRRS